MKLPPKLQAFLVAEQLAGKYQHGIIQFGKPRSYGGRALRVCRCGEPLGREGDTNMITHLETLELWKLPYAWEAILYWTKD